MIVFPNAKINIGLYVTDKRDDGYHNIATIFYPLPLMDVLEIVDAEHLSLTIHNRKIEGELADNLIYKAYQLLSNDFDITPVETHILKNIPLGAGLGGGSSDGAFMLSALNHHFELNIPPKNLARYALKLGSDAPFFCFNQPMLGTGRGEILSPIPLNLTSKWISIIHPNIHSSTKEAFNEIKPAHPSIDLKQIVQLPIKEWQSHLKNDFEDYVFNKHPEVKAIKDHFLNDAQVDYCQMSGSGSSVYAISTDKIEIPSQFKEYFVYQAQF
jgi:4-diphosphocytidyl-2-C-methyl-D-erythritol kinase